MNASAEIKELYNRYVMPTYTPSLVLVRGDGVRVWDADGREYLDFLAGIAVIGVGHCHPKVVAAVRRQAGTLMHVSNLFYNEVQPRLARKLSELSMGGKCFFCNSGAEANEAAIKLARLWGHDAGRCEVVTMRNSFHGRTLATAAATGQTKIQKGFEPMPEGFRYAEFNDLDSVRAAVSERTAAVLFEVVQGEGGIVIASREFVRGLRALCDEAGVLLLCDEVQTGLGRTGHWFAFQGYDVEPDAFSLAKGLGNGFPIGALVTSPALADVFRPGHHASTFGGTPLACAAALANLEVIESEDLVANAAAMGDELRRRLADLATKHPRVTGVRSMGLMAGLVFDREVKDLAARLIRNGLLTVATAGNVIRFLPPLTVTEADIGQAMEIVDRSIGEWMEAGDAH